MLPSKGGRLAFTLLANSAINRTDHDFIESVTALKSLAPTSLVQAFEHQDEAFSSALSVVRDAIARRAFPAASVAVTHQGRLVVLKTFGRFTYESDSPAVSPGTLFDLASITKVVATTTMAMILYERGLLELDAPVVGTLPEFLADSCGDLDARRHDVTFRMLLAHSSGLPAYEKLFLKAHSRDELLLGSITTALFADPGSRAEYSDIGFIVLGTALERIVEETLDVFGQREVFGPLAMTRTTFNPPTDTRSQIPPTADERAVSLDEETLVRELHVERSPSGENREPARSTFRKRIIQGAVQDENASVLGGVAGHAGLFSTAEDLALFAHAMLSGGHPILRPETVALFTRRESAPAGTSHALGWDTPSAPSQSGEYFSPASYGHLGYTGTSLWVDPERQLSVTLLTNRTWPDCSNQVIKQVRPKFYDAVMEDLREG